MEKGRNVDRSCVVGIRGLGGSFKSLRMLGSVSVAMGRDSIIYLVNTDKSNGDALLHYLGFLRLGSDNGVVFRNRGIRGRARSLGGMERGMKVIFRRFRLFPRVAILRGIVRTPLRIGGLPGSRMGGSTRSLLGGMKLSSGRGMCPSGLSNKRGRHMTVTETLTVGPSVVLFSRPASTLSPRLMKRILSAVGRLTLRKVAVIIIARRVNFTERMTS